jgi:hypothetical protein
VRIAGLALSFALEIPLSTALVALIHWVGNDAILRLLAYVLGFSTLLVVLMVPLGEYWLLYSPLILFSDELTSLRLK